MSHFLLRSNLYQLNQKVLCRPIDYHVKSYAYYAPKKQFFVVDSDNILRVYDQKWNLLAQKNGIKYVTYGIDRNFMTKTIIGIDSKNMLHEIHLVNKNGEYHFNFINIFEHPVSKVVVGYQCIFVIDIENTVWAKGYNFYGELALDGFFYSDFTVISDACVYDIFCQDCFTTIFWQDGTISYHGHFIKDNSMPRKFEFDVSKVCYTGFNIYFVYDNQFIETGMYPHLDPKAKLIDIATCGSRVAVLHDDKLVIHNKVSNSRSHHGQSIYKPLIFNAVSLKLIN